MAIENLYKRKLRLKYKVIVDGNEKTTSQNYENIKLTSNVNDLYDSAVIIQSLMNVPSVDIEKEDTFTLENE